MSLSNPQKQPKSEPITDRNYILGFGKYRGESIADIMEYDKQYLNWLHCTFDNFELGWELLEEIEN